MTKCKCLDIMVGPECLATNADVLRERLYNALRGEYSEIYLDFTDTLHMDAAGVGVIAAVIFEGRRRGYSILMKGASGSVLDILTATGLYRKGN